MKKVLFTVFCFYGSLCLTMAQGNTSYDLQAFDRYISDYLDDNYGNSAETKSANSPAHKDFRPYLLEVTFQKDLIRVEEAQLDLMSHEVAIRLEGEMRYLPAKYIKGIEVMNDDETEAELKYINPTYYGISRQVKSPLIEVVVDGPVSLYREHSYTVQTSAARYDPVTGGGGEETTLKEKVQYYLGSDLAFVAIESRRTFRNALREVAGNDFDPKQYAKENKLNVNRPDDWPAIVEASRME